MDLVDVVRIAARRWYVLLPLLLLSGVLSGVVYASAQTSYTTGVSIGIALPSTQTAPAVVDGQPRVTRTNPLVESGGTVLLANLLSIGLEDPIVAGPIAPAGGTLAYTVTVVTGTQSTQLPLVKVEVTDATSASVQSATDELIGQARTTLASIQTDAGVPEDLRATTYLVQPPYDPEPETPGRTRATAAAAAVGIALSALVTVLVDGALARRSRRGAGAAR